MAQQNIYDNEIFFEGYKKIRDNDVNANNLFFHRKIHYVCAIQAETDGQEMKMVTKYI